MSRVDPNASSKAADRATRPAVSTRAQTTPNLADLPEHTRAVLDRLMADLPPGVEITPNATPAASARIGEPTSVVGDGADAPHIVRRPQRKRIAVPDASRPKRVEHVVPRPRPDRIAPHAAAEADSGVKQQLPHLSPASRARLEALAADRLKKAEHRPENAAPAAAPNVVRHSVASEALRPQPLQQQAPVQPVADPDVARRMRVDAAGNGLTGWIIGRVFGQGELADAIQSSRKSFAAIGMFSLVINLLMLTGPLFMLQVYDRVMTSGSLPTLAALTIIAVVLYGVIGALELIRSRLVVRIGTEIDQRVGDRVFEAALRSSVSSQQSSVSALRELDGFRQFVAGPGPLTFCDAPWTPIYLLVIFAVHWAIGLAALAGAVILMLIAWLGEAESRTPLTESGKAAGRSIEIAETGQRNAEAIMAMGMLGAYRQRWHGVNGEALAWQLMAADRIGTYSAASKTLRLLMQSLLLALGAALAVMGSISAGAIIACTIIFGRALAPVEQIIGQWRSFVKARESLGKLEALLRAEPPAATRTALPAPKGKLEVVSLRVAAPETRQLILSNLTFEAKPGQMLAVIGPSASGKSSLVKALVGLWQPFSGSVKLDGSRLDQWSPEELGRHIGYVPQSVELFSGTVRANIARFRENVADGDVVEAAKMAHAHDLILALPKGYDTELGPYGTYLSGGQRQRIGLARALFGHPHLVVLDEPNANLDRLGDEALGAAIDGMRRRGQVVILVSHRVQAIAKADMILYIDRGVQRAFGPRNEVMRMFQGSNDLDLPNRRREDGKSGPADRRTPSSQRGAP